MSPQDRARIEELLQDESLSFRAIGREVGFSDFTVRQVARELAGEPPVKRVRHTRDDYSGEPLDLTGWGILVGVAALFIGAIWFWGSGMPPADA